MHPEPGVGLADAELPDEKSQERSIPCTYVILPWVRHDSLRKSSTRFVVVYSRLLSLAIGENGMQYPKGNKGE